MNKLIKVYLGDSKSKDIKQKKDEMLDFLIKKVNFAVMN